MSGENGTSVLFAKLDSEKKTGELLPLPADFYKTIEQEIGKASADPENKQRQNAMRTLAALRARRTQKLLTYLAYGKQPPQQLPQEEESIYNEVKRILNKESKPQKATKLRILMKIPEIITTSGQKIGPFSSGDIIISEDSKDVEFMISNKIGEIVEQ